jgi:high affinity Mn2+ porin
MVPTEANLSVMDGNIKEAHALQLEVERKLGRTGREAVIRLLVYQNAAHMGNYNQAVALMPMNPDITATRAYGRTKTGFGINAEKKLTDHIGAFVRGSWNDGKNETWMFTEIDQSFSLGAVTDGRRWNREDDDWGLAFVQNGVSQDHRNYLGAGGTGFMIGDGRINYGTENIFETYYRLSAFNHHIYITSDYQLILNPAYNKDRGPANVVALRVQAVF